LDCTSNLLTSLNVNQNTNLATLYCGINQLVNLSLDQNINMEELDCFSNSLSRLNLKNGNNTNFIYFNATSNPNLTCIEVDDSTYSTTNWADVDSIATFSPNCSVFNNINTINEAISLTAYPNPTTKGITLDFGKLYQEANIQVTNITGQTVLSKTVQNNSITKLELEGAAGVYFVKIKTEEGTATLKVIKE
jgi:hypothetical protein